MLPLVVPVCVDTSQGKPVAPATEEKTAIIWYGAPVGRGSQYVRKYSGGFVAYDANQAQWLVVILGFTD